MVQVHLRLSRDTVDRHSPVEAIEFTSARPQTKARGQKSELSLQTHINFLHPQSSILHTLTAFSTIRPTWTLLSARD
jgi:hypothetical protein